MSQSQTGECMNGWIMDNVYDPTCTHLRNLLSSSSRWCLSATLRCHESSSDALTFCLLSKRVRRSSMRLEHTHTQHKQRNSVSLPNSTGRTCSGYGVSLHLLTVIPFIDCLYPFYFIFLSLSILFVFLHLLPPVAFEHLGLFDLLCLAVGQLFRSFLIGSNQLLLRDLSVYNNTLNSAHCRLLPIQGI